MEQFLSAEPDTKVMLVTSCRPAMLLRLLESFREQRLYEDGWMWAICLQGFDKAERKAVCDATRGALLAINCLQDRQPAYLARHALWQALDGLADVICHVDDDMVYLPTSNYGPMVHLAMSRTVGLISGNWIRFNTPALWARKRIEDRFVSQPIVYTGGGLVFASHALQALLQAPAAPYLYDDVQYSLVCYLAGLDNFRYLGSVTEHNILSAGGNKTLYAEQALTPPDPRYLVTRRTAKTYYPHEAHNIMMPSSSDLTPFAKRTHEQARKAIMKGSGQDPAGPVSS